MTPESATLAMAANTLTPRTLALGRLIFLCVTDEALGRMTRHRLTLLLLHLVTGAGGATSALEPPLGELLSQLANEANMAPEWVSQFEHEMREMVIESDDVWNLVVDLYALTQPSADPDAHADAPMLLARIEPSSVFGLFARRVRVSFELASFEQLCSATTHLRAWLSPSVLRTPAELVLSQPGDKPRCSLVRELPPGAQVLPRTQLKELISLRVAQMEQGLPLALGTTTVSARMGMDSDDVPPMHSNGDSIAPAALQASCASDAARGVIDDAMEAQLFRSVKELEALAPEVSQVSHLQSLFHTQARDLPSALESFHRYHDCCGVAATLPPASVAAAAADTQPGGVSPQRDPDGSNVVGGVVGAGSTSEPAVRTAGQRVTRRSVMQWADLNLGRLLLGFGHREQALTALHEAVKLAQQVEDNVCFAHTMLWLAHAHDGMGANVWGQLTTPQKRSLRHEATRSSLLQKCLARSHELKLPEVAALASAALALHITIEAGAAPETAASTDSTSAAAAAAAVTTTSSSGSRGGGEGSLRAPCLPPAPLGSVNARPTLPRSFPPPLRAWEAMRCGADGVSASAQLIRSCAWERFGDFRLAALHATLQLRLYHPPTVTAVGDRSGKESQGGLAKRPSQTAPGPVGIHAWAGTATQHDRLLAACKLASLLFRSEGEGSHFPAAPPRSDSHINTLVGAEIDLPRLDRPMIAALSVPIQAVALRRLLPLRSLCTFGTARSTWLTHTADILLRGALLRGERCAAAQLLQEYTSLLAATDGPSDAAWAAELELLIQDGKLLEAVTRSEELQRTTPTGRGAGSSAPQVACLLAQAKAHYLGGTPVNAITPALAALALSESRGLRAHAAAAALALVGSQLELDPTKALSLLQKHHSHLMHHGTPHDVATLQLLSARCRLASLMPFSPANPPTSQALQAHTLPTLNEALRGYGRIGAHTEAAEAAYLISRALHSLGDVAGRDAAAALFVEAEAAAARAAARPAGARTRFAQPGALEAHLTELEGIEREAATMYSPKSEA